MNQEEIIKMAFELGNTIAESAELNELKLMQSKLNQDYDATNLIVKYQDAKMKQENNRNNGLIITKEEVAHMEILEQQLNNNDLIRQILSAQEKFDNLMQAVYYAINQAISGNCSGSCDSCGDICS